MWLPLSSLREGRREGSYFARNWHRLYCEREGWQWNRPVWFNEWDIYQWMEAPDGMFNYRTITSALARAQSNITSFAVGDELRWEKGVPPPLFDARGYSTRKRALGMDVTAFASLERLVLRFATCVEDNEGPSAPDLCSEIAGLQTLLRSLKRLKYLELRLPDDRSPPTYYYLDKVFSKDNTWLKLESLTLTNVSTTATELLHFVLCRTPSLKRLVIAGINFREGSWEAFLVSF